MPRAIEAIKNLENSLKKYEKEYYQEFDERIEEVAASAKLGEMTETNRIFRIKTEYQSEFSLAKIAAVIGSVLKVAAATRGPSFDKIPLNSEAVDAYTDLVNSIAEAAKTNTQMETSFTFNWIKLTPDFAVFLMSKSSSIQDEALFGSESVCSTAVLYKGFNVTSVEKLKVESEEPNLVGPAAAEFKALVAFKALQLSLSKRIAEDLITIATGIKLDGKYAMELVEINDRIKIYKYFDKGDYDSLINKTLKKHVEGANLAFAKLNTLGESYQSMAQILQSRIKG